MIINIVKAHFEHLGYTCRANTTSVYIIYDTISHKFARNKAELPITVATDKTGQITGLTVRTYLSHHIITLELADKDSIQQLNEIVKTAILKHRIEAYKELVINWCSVCVMIAIMVTYVIVMVVGLITTTKSIFEYFTQ